MKGYSFSLDRDIKKYRCIRYPLTKGILPPARAVLKLAASVRRPENGVTVSKIKIPSFDGFEIPALIYTPNNVQSNAPCFVYFHGGGFVMEAAPQHFRITEQVAARVPCKSVLVFYRLAPKYAFPTPVNDCLAAYNWIIKNAETVGIDKYKIALAGDSAGGNLAAAVSLMARDNKIIIPCLQMMLYPVIDRRMNTSSMKKYTNTPMWNTHQNEKMWQWYLPDGEKTPHIEYASPIEAKSLKGLPNAYIEIAEYDCLHDEGIAYAAALKEHGNNVRLFETKGTLHGFDIAANSKVVNNCMNERIKYLKNAFNAE